jgi:hypothetical protein
MATVLSCTPASSIDNDSKATFVLWFMVLKSD